MAGTGANARGGDNRSDRKTPNAFRSGRDHRSRLQRRYHSTNFGRPALNGVVGLYPSNRFAFEISAQVRGTSPGCSGNWLIFAFFPNSFSMAAIKSFNSMV